MGRGGVPQLVYVDGAGDRWKLVGMRIWTTLQSERSGAVTTVDERTMTQLGMEMDGKLVKPVGLPAKAGCT